MVGWKKVGSFLSQYKSWCEAETGERNKRLWKAKIPLKIKIFMWLIKVNAILTRNNLARKGWKCDKTCSFSANPESIEHLFFGCVMTKYCWSLVSIVIGADCRPASLNQYWVWANRFMPAHKKIHMIGLAAICWAIWRMRNSIFFEDIKKCRSPTKIICLASSFILYWSDPQSSDDKSNWR